MNEQCPVGGCERIRTLEARVKTCEDAVAKHDVVFAKINTKLNGILWACGVIGSALVGVLIKLLFGG